MLNKFHEISIHIYIVFFPYIEMVQVVGSLPRRGTRLYYKGNAIIFFVLAMQGILCLYVLLFYLQGDGNMIYMERNGGSTVSSKLMTPYKNTDGICIELYYWGHGNFSLIVEIRGEDFIPRLLVSRVRVTNQHWFL